MRKKSKPKKRNQKRNKKMGGGSMMVPVERTKKVEGDLVSDDRSYRNKEFSESVYLENEKTAEAYAKRYAAEMAKDMDPIPSKKDQTIMRETLKNAEMDRLMQKGREAYEESKREGNQEGGMPEAPIEIPEAPMEEPTEDVPEDTYANATPEEIEAAQEPDDVMEEDYIEFVLNEALVPEEQQYLMNTLEGDPQLSQIFDKVVETASEFSGAGEVKGPGDGISDSIPARLSDGEFVMTQKATEQLGADNLQTMMDDAERAYDGGMMRENRYLGGSIQVDEDDLGQGKSTDDDIRKLMSIKANKTPSLR